MRVGVVDPADPQAFAGWFTVVDASGRDRWPGRPGWQPDELRAPALDPDAPVPAVLLAAGGPGGTEGAGMVELPRHDNRHLANVTVEVLPARRRRGVGGALLAACERVAAEDGRRVLCLWEERRLPAVRAPGFAGAHGYDMVLEQLRRELPVPLDPGLAARLEVAAWGHAAGYEVATFSAPWPGEWLEERARFGRHMSTDAPTGGWALQEEAWDPDRVRRQERLVDRMGREVLVAVARHRATDRLVAFTELTVPRTAPAVAYQWDTLVLPEHRGHRLGLLVKLANLRRLAAVSPATSLVVTWNSRANTPMIDVNDTLGCQVTAVGRIWQKAVG